MTNYNTTGCQFLKLHNMYGIISAFLLTIVRTLTEKLTMEKSSLVLVHPSCRLHQDLLGFLGDFCYVSGQLTVLATVSVQIERYSSFSYQKERKFLIKKLVFLDFRSIRLNCTFDYFLLFLCMSSRGDVKYSHFGPFLFFGVLSIHFTLYMPSVPFYF